MQENPKIILSDVPIIFKKAFIKVANMEKGVSGFRTTEIYPLNPDVFCEEDFLGANDRTVYDYATSICNEQLLQQPDEQIKGAE